MLVLVALIERMAAPVVVELVIVVIGVGGVGCYVAGGGGVSERIPRRVITRKHFHAAESASKLIPGSVSISSSFDRSLTSRLPATMNF